MHLLDSNGDFNHVPDAPLGAESSNTPATRRQLRLVLGVSIGFLLILGIVLVIGISLI